MKVHVFQCQDEENRSRSLKSNYHNRTTTVVEKTLEVLYVKFVLDFSADLMFDTSISAM